MIYMGGLVCCLDVHMYLSVGVPEILRKYQFVHKLSIQKGGAVVTFGEYANCQVDEVELIKVYIHTWS